MKDEVEGNLMLEFLGLRAKAYSYQYEKEVYVDENGNEVHEKTDLTKLTIDEVQKLNGMKKCVVKNNINHEHYKRCIFDGQKHYETMKTFRSYNHNISTISQNKLALTRYDDKRYILDDGIETLAHGHYKTL